MSKNRIAIIGGGASGLLCSIILKYKKPDQDVVLIEKFSKMGRKLLTTGNGKCNFTNLFCSGEKFNESKFAQKILDEFDVEKTIDMFDSLGVESFADSEGRVYPVTKQASSVRDSLLNCAKHLGVMLENNVCVNEIQRLDKKFKLKFSGEGVENLIAELKNADEVSNPQAQGSYGSISIDEKFGLFDYVIVACGSEAGGEIYKKNDILDSLGIKKTTVYPSLVPVLTDKGSVKFLDGVRQDAGVELFCGDESIAKTNGEVLFRNYGLSGICIFELSHYISLLQRYGKKDISVILDMMTQFSYDELLIKLSERMKRCADKYTAGEFFVGLINDKLAKNLFNVLGISENAGAGILGKSLEKICGLLKRRKFTISGLKDFESAQVCLGGVCLTEVNENLRVKNIPNLYVCGEALDVNGNCGGNNLQFAWSCAVVASTDLIKNLA